MIPRALTFLSTRTFQSEPHSTCVLITPPDQETVALAAAKIQLRVDDTSEDDLIQALLDACVAQLDPASGGWLGRALRPQTWELRLNRFPIGPIKIPYAALIQVDAFTYTDGAGTVQTLTEDEGFRLVDGGFYESSLIPPFGQCWPCARYDAGSVKVRFTCGYAKPNTGADPLPKAVPGAVFLLLRQLYDFMSRNGFVASEDAYRVATTTYFANGNADQVLAAARSLLSSCRLNWF